MLFNSLEFWLFFALVFGVYVTLSHVWQNRFLLLASLIFYSFSDHEHAWTDPLHYRFVGLMVATAAFDYYIGNKLAALSDAKLRKMWLVFSVVMNLLVLGYFKYCNFLVDSVQRSLAAFGVNVRIEMLQITLPVAISFYTFQSMAYTIDIYRGRLQPAKNLRDFLLFVAYFPHLVAGPINRPQGLLSQCQNPRRMTWDGWTQGAILILVGLFKKVAVADLLAPMAEQTFSNPERCSASTLLLGLYCFAFQIYADFSGYTDIARGLAKIMGFELMENFNQPYFATNITDFWRRWHISLSSWLRDYLYIPLGGNRHGNAQTYRNLFLTMFLGGLWHGASWTYAIWGALHGIYLAIHKLILGEKKPGMGMDGHAFVRIAKMLATFHLVAFAWIFFRAAGVADTTGDHSLARAWTYIKGLAAFGAQIPANLAIEFDADQITSAGLAVAALLLIIDIPQYLRKDHCVMLRWPPARRVAACAILCVWLVLTRRMDNVPFIYFQF